MRFIKMPPELLDLFMNNQLNESQRKVLACVIKKTTGFHKKWDQISLSQFEALTGLGRRHVNSALRELVSKKILLKKTGNSIIPNSWSINPHIFFSLTSVQNDTSVPEVVTKREHTKDILQKKYNINTKKKSFSSDISRRREKLSATHEQNTSSKAITPDMDLSTVGVVEFDRLLKNPKVPEDTKNILAKRWMTEGQTT